jgi:hypothetical protein
MRGLWELGWLRSWGSYSGISSDVHEIKEEDFGAE